MAQKALKQLPSNRVTIFKLENRRGYAALALRHLTEGRSPQEAFTRMTKAMKRSGYELTGGVPRSR